MTPECRVSSCFAAVVALALAPGVALADGERADAARGMTKKACVEANTRGQSLRREGKLDAAREALRTCADDRCPALVRDDCVERLDELERARPTVVFDVKDPTGADVVVVRVSMDGVVVAERVTGGPLPVEPGEHTFTFEAPGRPAVQLRFVLKEGEKARRERIVLDADPTPHVAPASAPAVVTEPTGTQHAAAIVLGASGLAGLAAGTVFGVLTIAASSSAKDACRTPASCADHAQAVSEHDRAQTTGTASTVAFIAGGALLGTGVALWLTSPQASRAPREARIVPFGLGLALEGAGWF